MFHYKSIREQLVEEKRKNAALRSQVNKNTSDVEFLAMMTDVEIDEPEDVMEVDHE